jgi:Dynein heavy chain C-terminal domain
MLSIIHHDYSYMIVILYPLTQVSFCPSNGMMPSSFSTFILIFFFLFFYFFYLSFYSLKANKWSLEDLELYLEIGCDTAEGVQDAVVEGLVLEGARSLPATSSSSSSSLELCEDLRTNLPPSRLRWRLKGDKPSYICTAFPLYLNTSRAELVTEIIVRTDGSAHVLPCIWAQRGVAFIIQSPQL